MKLNDLEIPRYWELSPQSSALSPGKGGQKRFDVGRRDALEVRSYWVLAGWHPPEE